VCVGKYTDEALKAKGWDKVEAEKWAARLAQREAGYEKRYKNLASTCMKTATGRDRKVVPTVAALLALNIMPSIPMPCERVAKKRENSCGAAATAKRQKQAKQLARGDKSCSTGIPARGNIM